MSTRRSKRVKNLEEEVESVFSQEESDEDTKAVLAENQKCAKTFLDKQYVEVITPRKESQGVLKDLIQTPRRSCRKSIKPAQDYDEIVKRSLRSCTRSGKKTLLDETSDDVNVQPKWNPAEVGRFSQKRSRKTKRLDKANNKNDCTEQIQEDSNDNIRKEDNVFQKAAEILKPSNHDFNESNQINQGDEKTDENPEKIQGLNVDQECLEEQELEQLPNSLVHYDSGVEVRELSLHLLQEDSEDDHESPAKSETEGICIVYENNISNDDTQSSPKSVTSVKKEDAFGCYLKCGEINISDLGLNPISHNDDKDNENFGNQDKTSPKMVDEMPSIIICDDEDRIDFKHVGRLNETFEASENGQIENCQERNQEIMETLQLSDDDCETPRKCPRIVITDISEQNHILSSNSKKELDSRARISSTPIAFANKLPSTPQQSQNASISKAKLPSTPKFPSTPQSKKQYRLPTPYRHRNFKFDVDHKENIRRTPNKGLQKSSVVTLTTMEPKEIVLRGIRKRSLSVCINEQQRKNLLVEPLSQQKKNRIVSFHSPANQTTIIDDLDTIIAKSLKKRTLQEKESSKKFVTTRRKRSLSLDESFMSASIASRLPRPVVIKNVANKSNTPNSTTLKRTKLPNFAAIHERQFNKMENLVDHVSRKQERSKNLINSATKLMPASAQKNISLNKSNSNKTAANPRALKKIDLKPNSQKMEKFDLSKKSAMPKKPAFNLSTSLVVKPTASTLNSVDKANTSRLNNDNKMESRLQRHMDLFKGRAASTRSGLTTRKNEAILKGVRSNRRFELQMKHRKNMEQ